MKRLNSILQFINKNDIIADVGCDHGYLLELAIKNKNIKKGYAIDNKIGPLNCAKKNLSHYNNIKFILSDGLIDVNENDINCMVIAGMGGMLMNKIINDSLSKVKLIDKIILCPNRDNDKVRMTMNHNGFIIEDEDIIYEDGKFYEIICFKKGIQSLTNKQLFFGPKLLEKRNNLFIKKWELYYNKIKSLNIEKDELKILEEVLYEN